MEKFAGAQESQSEKSVHVSRFKYMFIPISPRVLSSLREPKAMAGRRMAM